MNWWFLWLTRHKMNQLKTNQAYCAIYLAITLLLLWVNASGAYKSHQLQTRLSELHRASRTKSKTFQQIRHAKSDLTKFYIQNGVHNGFYENLIRQKEFPQLDPAQLLTEDTTLWIVPSYNSGQHDFDVLAADSNNLEIVFEVTHQVYNPVRDLDRLEVQKKVHKYSFSVPIIPNAWNNIRSVVSTNLRKECAFKSIVNGQVTGSATLPNLQNLQSKSQIRIFVGKPLPNTDGICYSIRPYIRTVQPSAEGVSESLTVNLVVRKLE